ncbi:MAG: oxidoreductase [Rhodoglobus sp.]|nr:oxidoreductase [Rhodoglobus sp.]
MGTVASTSAETPSGRSIWIDVPDWAGNIAGQHVDVRLTAPDGYQATRSYSLASSGPSPRLQLAVDKLPDGEVSPYLVDDLRAGDMLELRGPLGGWFVWSPSVEQPVQLIAGGSGVVPLVAMIRAHAASGSTAPMQLLYSVRTPDDRFFADELEKLDNITYAYTRSGPPDATIGRLTKERLAAAVLPVGSAVFVCGPTGFVEAVASWLVDLGHDASLIKTERFGGA